MPGPTRADLDRALKSFDWDAWNERLETLYAPWYRDSVDAAGQESADAIDGRWRSDTAGVEAFGKEYIGQRITQIDDTTRARVADVVQSYFEDLERGDTASLADLGAALTEQFDEFSRSRASTIARTETAYAINHGQAFNYQQSGYNYVLISDGDDFDEPCAEADGQIWSIDYFLANAIEHPNCERSASPISDDDAEAEGIDED